MLNPLKALWVAHGSDTQYQMKGVFQSSEEIKQYSNLFLTEQDRIEIRDYTAPHIGLRPCSNGEYIYQLVETPNKTVYIERILAPESFDNVYIDHYPALPRRIILSAKNGEAARKKALRFFAEKEE